MKIPTVVIITGPPGAGKTSLGQIISKDLHLPFINKDDYKDILFDILGWKDRQWSMKLGQASFEILFHSLECQLNVHQSAVVETAFIPWYHSERFQQIQSKFDCKYIQVVCKAEIKVLYERFINRTSANERHPGHVDHLISYDQFEKMLQSGKYDTLNVGGSTLVVDTTDFDTLDVGSVLSELRKLVG